MIKKQFKAVLFDLDGTLLDTLEDIGGAMNHILEEKGLPTHEMDDYRYFVGEGAAILVKRALPEKNRNEETIGECLEAFKKYYASNWQVKTKPYEGVPEMLDALRARNYKLAILSNKPHEFTKLCAEELLPKWNFDLVFGMRDAVPPKPDPAGALEVAEGLKLLPSDFLYAGDTAIDMKTASAAGMFPLGVLWGFRTREELIENGAKALINHPLALLDFF